MIRRRALQALLALPFAARVGSVGATNRRPTALGYLPWWMAPGWQSLPLGHIDRLVLFDAPVAADGALEDRPWLKLAPGLMAHCARAGVPIDVALTLFEQARFETLFSDAARRGRLLEATTALLEHAFVAGIHLDIEGYSEVSPRAIVGFRAWLGELEVRRRGLGKNLSGFFPASDVFRAYEQGAATWMDYWVAQLYDAHWPESKATGPLVTRSPRNPVGVQRALERLLALGVQRQSVLLSVPLYGWEWPSLSRDPGAATTGRARLLTYNETPAELMPNDRLAATTLARRHRLLRDGEHTPYYVYADGADWRQGWFEDLESLTRKLEPERGAGYGGLAFFPLGYDKGEIVAPLLQWWRARR